MWWACCTVMHQRGQDGVLYGWGYVRKRAGRFVGLMPSYLRSSCACAQGPGACSGAVRSEGLEERVGSQISGSSQGPGALLA